MRVRDTLAMCGRRVRNYASAHAPSGTLTFWRRLDGARPVPAIQEATERGLAKCQASKRRRAMDIPRVPVERGEFF